MNAYPAELVLHHYACMLVSGLLPSQSQVSSPPEASKTDTTPTDAKETRSSKEKPAVGSSPPVQSPSSSPRVVTESTSPPPPPPPPAAAASSSFPSSSAQASSSRAPTPAQAFPQVTKDLCEIFSSRGKNTAWDPSKGQSAVFHTVLVDNNVRLPPKKTRPTPRTLNATGAEQQSSLASLQPRSPLSPLHPSSPLFPDGLIAPIWVRKHRELVPSVFVSFYCLSEQQQQQQPTVEHANGITDEAKAASTANGAPPQGLSGADLKKRDEDLIRVISDRKRALGERGIKFTVVLLTTRAMLESPTLESRLSYIRRSSQLDSRASLFVLTPVSRNELGEFVTSLQSALYESAQDYYREHNRRAKKKRSRYPPPSATVSQIMGAAAEIRGSPVKDAPLSKEGWLARNDYKLGTFAELMGNLSEALMQYTSAYQLLINELLASTMLLPPRTKRWAEAKVLSDCLNMKICKIHLYRDDGDSAWDQFRMHVKRFRELSQGWGIGEMTFEFWSWLGKQYRLMGDLLDLATREIPGSPLPAFRVPEHFPSMPTFLLHPSHLPTPTANGHFAPSNNPHHGNLALPNELALNAAIIPSEMCQGPGECFYLAGICAMERWQRFRRMVWEEENDRTKSEEGTWSTLSQEKKIDHAAQAIEVFNRAHEVFKRFRHQRQSLLVASKIATAYIEGGQDEMALRFLERISKSYRVEGWTAQTTSLLLQSLECARRIRNSDSEGRALWSLLCAKVPLSSVQRKAAQSAMQEWMSKRDSHESESSGKRLVLESSSTDGPLLIESAMAMKNINVDEQGSLFQLRITSPPGSSLQGICFDELHLYFAGYTSAFVVRHEEMEAESVPSSIAIVGQIALNSTEQEVDIGKADLRWWSEGTTRALQGFILPEKVGLLQLEKISLLGRGASDFTLDFHLTGDDGMRLSLAQPRWLAHANPPLFVLLEHRENKDGLMVAKRAHKVIIDLVHEKEAFLEETFAIDVRVKNEDASIIRCSVEAAIIQETKEADPPSAISASLDRLWLGMEGDDAAAQATHRIEEVELGAVEPGKTLSKTLYLQCLQLLRVRTIDILVKTSIPGDDSDVQRSESLHTIVVPVKTVLAPAFHASWRTIKESSLAIPPGTIRRPSITVSGADESGSSEAPVEVPLSIQAEGEVQSTNFVAAINVGLSNVAKEEILVDAVSMRLDKESRHLRLTGENDRSEDRHIVEQVWASGDRWGTVFDVEVLSEAITGFPIEADDGSLRFTGHLIVEWRRRGREGKEGKAQSKNILVIDVPLLLPPPLLSRIVVSTPTLTTLEQPLVMLLSVVNPSKLSTDIFISVDDSQADFGILSHKSFTVPLIAKSTRSVPVHLLSKSTRGRDSPHSIRLLPRIRAWQRDRRVKREDGEEEPNTATKPSATIPIMNQQRGGGLPLEVQLRYSKVASSSAAHQQQNSSGANPYNNAVAQLQTETQKSGAWSIFVTSQSAVDETVMPNA